MDALDIILDILLVGVAVAGGVTDLLKRKIYDFVTYPAIALGLILRFGGHGFGGVFDLGLLSAIFGAGFCALVFGVFYLWGRGFGGGDVKLMTAVGALGGFVYSLSCAMATAIVGAVLALIFLVASKKGRASMQRLFRRGQAGEERATIPYGVAIALGVIWAASMKYGVLPGSTPAAFLS
jgi:prepilin peptidase CpaA